jgi:hypothetical protein
MIYLHCKFYNVIKINYGGPDTGHVTYCVFRINLISLIIVKMFNFIMYVSYCVS